MCCSPQTNSSAPLMRTALVHLTEHGDIQLVSYMLPSPLLPSVFVEGRSSAGCQNRHRNTNQVTNLSNIIPYYTINTIIAPTDCVLSPLSQETSLYSKYWTHCVDQWRPNSPKRYICVTAPASTTQGTLYKRQKVCKSQKMRKSVWNSLYYRCLHKQEWKIAISIGILM